MQAVPCSLGIAILEPPTGDAPPSVGSRKPAEVEGVEDDEPARRKLDPDVKRVHELRS